VGKRPLIRSDILRGASTGHFQEPAALPNADECCSDFTEENEHKDYYENDTENSGRPVSPGAAIAPGRKSPYEHEDKKN
jgi:hypothetical protein